MTNDKNILIQKVGKENYQNLESLVKENYAHDLKEMELNKENCGEQLTKLIAKMKAYDKPSPYIIRDYLASLKETR